MNRCAPIPAIVALCLAVSSSHIQARTDGHETHGSVSQASPIDIEMNIDARPSIAGKFGGVDVQVTYDTGSQGGMIDRRLVEKFQLEIIGEALVGSPAGGEPKPIQLVSISGLEIAGQPIPAVGRGTDAIVAEEGMMPPGVELIIGNNQFPDRQITLDFAKRRFVVTAAPETESADVAIEGRLDVRGLPVAELELSGQTLPVHIDTGNPGGIDFGGDVHKQIKFESELRAGKEIRLVDKVMSTEVGYLNSDATLQGRAIRLQGNFRFTSLPFANVGASAMAGTRLVIDMKRRSWQLQTPAEPWLVIGKAS